jgi:hypothetical protein
VHFALSERAVVEHLSALLAIRVVVARLYVGRPKAIEQASNGLRLRRELLAVRVTSGTSFNFFCPYPWR